mgnify:CR=1 FL=1
MEAAKGLMHTCYQMYVQTPTGLAPEIVRFSKGNDMFVDSGAKHSFLRPETVESLFVMYRITGDTRYQDWGYVRLGNPVGPSCSLVNMHMSNWRRWNIFKSIMKHAKVESGGFSGLRDVTVYPPVKNDHQESFFLSETLKYLVRCVCVATFRCATRV